jgi:hypothetical protein
MKFQSARKYAMTLAVLSVLSIVGLAQETALNPTAPTAAKVEQEQPKIQDNSFLVEEAYNQEFGVVQHIQTMQRMWPTKDWVYAFTQEWPAPFSPKHQLSYTVPVIGQFAGVTKFGDVALNYRYQLIGSGETKVAFSPRFSLLLPTGDYKNGLGAGGTGFQINLPLSVVHTSKLATHWNLGTTLTPNQKDASGATAFTGGVNVGQSFIYSFTNRFNGLLETVWNSTESVVGQNKTDRDHSLLVSPGIRWAYNLKNGTQIVPGVAVPIGVGPSRGDVGMIFYLSIEHPFRRLLGK